MQMGCFLSRSGRDLELNSIQTLYRSIRAERSCFKSERTGGAWLLLHLPRHLQQFIVVGLRNRSLGSINEQSAAVNLPGDIRQISEGNDGEKPDDRDCGEDPKRMQGDGRENSAAEEKERKQQDNQAAHLQADIAGQRFAPGLLQG